MQNDTAALHQRATRLDQNDALAGYREGFAVPDQLIYLDGNSLGAFQPDIASRVADTLTNQWGQQLIGGWNDAGWFDAPLRVGDLIAPLIGAGAGEVAVCDSTSINLFKAVDAMCQTQPDRTRILSQGDNFATDNYMVQALARLNPALDVAYFVTDDELEHALATGDVACVLLSQVDYRSAAKRDLPATTARIQAHGARVVWDLSHSTGAVELDLRGSNADAAVGCTYKYLNGGPGAPAYIWIHPTWIDQVSPALPGWMGNAQPFDFQRDYQPHAGIRRMICGTPSILSLHALDAAMRVWASVDMVAVQRKSQSLSQWFIECVQALCPADSVSLRSPHTPEQRGSHLAFAHPNAYAVVQALIARGVIGDFRAPDLIRVGFAPLYLSHLDVLRAAMALADVLETGEWDQPKFHAKARVT